MRLIPRRYRLITAEKYGFAVVIFLACYEQYLMLDGSDGLFFEKPGGVSI